MSDERMPQRVGRPRGSYRPYDLDPNVPVPRQTMRSRLLREERPRMNQQINAGEIEGRSAEDPGPPEHYSSTDDGSSLQPADPDNDTYSAEMDTSTEEVISNPINLIGDNDISEETEDSAQNGPRCNVVCEYGHCPPPKAPNAAGAGGARYSSRYDWNGPLTTAQITTTKFEALLAILHLSMRHNMTMVEIEDLMKFVNAIVGCKALPTKKYMFNTIFSPKSSLKYHFYCQKCEKYLGEKSEFPGKARYVKCAVCKNDCNIYDLEDGGNFFVTFSVKEQLEDVINKPDIKILDHLDRDTDAICDIMDGKLYRELCEPGMPLSDPNALTITFSTDGAPIFDMSLWPIQFICNEVCPEQRFQERNLMVAGLWFGRGSPNMSVFFKAFIKEMQALSTAAGGISRKGANGESVNCPVFALFGVGDSPAKAKMLCLKQHGGHCSCPYGYHPCPNRVYPSNIECVLRTHAEMAEDMITAQLLESSGSLKRSADMWDDVNGLKGVSPFLYLPYFLMPYSFPIDYMHVFLPGVSVKLHELFFDSTLDKPYCIKSSIDEVNARLLAITPPNLFSPRPESICDRSQWKCAQWEWYLLFYVLPCLENILPEIYFENIKCLVEGLHIFLGERISPEDLNHAEELFKNFVTGFNRLYGEENMVSNVHMCLHIGELVRQTGGLWDTSAYHFESYIGHLGKLVQGTRYVVQQIARKYSMYRSLPHYMEGMLVSDRIRSFCVSVCSYTPLKESTAFPEANANALGSQQSAPTSDEEKLALSNAGIPRVNSISFFNRIARDGLLYYSKAYKKPKRYDDTCVRLSSGKYAVVEKLFKTQDMLKALVRPLRISAHESLTQHIKKCAQDRFEPLEIVSFNDVARKVVFVKIKSSDDYDEDDDSSCAYVCDIPNFIKHT